MNARNIDVCLDSIAELDIPKLYMQGYTEHGIMTDAFPAVLEHDFDWLWLVSDDLIVRQPALDAVRQLRDSGDHPVVTGYSQFAHADWTVNLTSEALRDSHPSHYAYVFRTYADCVSYPSPAIPTWFTGMSLTGMSHDLWQEFPFHVDFDPGWASDFLLSKRLQDAGVPIVAVREGFTYHWRHHGLYGADERDEKVQIGNPRVTLVEERVAA
jgi:hypothetical protein